MFIVLLALAEIFNWKTAHCAGYPEALPHDKDLMEYLHIPLLGAP